MLRSVGRRTMPDVFVIVTNYQSETADKIVGSKIKVRRKSLKMTQKHLAGIVGVTAQQIQKYESGTNRITMDMFVKICHGLKMRPEQFLTSFSFCEGTSEYEKNLESKLLAIFRMIDNPIVKTRILDLVKALVSDEDNQ
ncbi:MAG: helix-turn-helix domain-containing protein [Holosporales bacterium]|jgi:transcriptional regulator with XRE-family HTH domain|nr:helix-turn-helix domain-containing protein [Holosporales bacterium]